MNQETDNVSVETPDFAKPESAENTEITKDVADKVDQIEKDAKDTLAKTHDEDVQNQVKKDADAQKAQVRKESQNQAKNKKTDSSSESIKIQGLRITVSGQYVNGDKKSNSYEFSNIVVPYCTNIMSYLKQIVFLQLKKKGEAVPLSDIITYYLDDEEEVMMDATFLNKDILTLTEQEVLDAKIYYKLKSVSVDQGIRQARVSAYKACCRILGIPTPADTDTQIKKWKRFKLSK